MGAREGLGPRLVDPRRPNVSPYTASVLKMVRYAGKIA
jgi:hypothetical protein